MIQPVGVSIIRPTNFRFATPRTLGFGFDDGPNCSHNAFYNYLLAQEQKATMSFIRLNVQVYPLEAARAVADGHQICVHTWSHPYMTATTNEGAFAELWYTMQMIKLATGVMPILRVTYLLPPSTHPQPPFGDVDRIRYIASQLVLETANYAALAARTENGTFDTVSGFRILDAAAIDTHTSANSFQVGAIMLTHELNNYTMQTAIDNYPKLAAAFDYTHAEPHSTSSPSRLRKTQPYVESGFTMQTFASCGYLLSLIVRPTLTVCSSCLLLHLSLELHRVSLPDIANHTSKATDADRDSSFNSSSSGSSGNSSGSSSSSGSSFGSSGPDSSSNQTTGTGKSGTSAGVALRRSRVGVRVLLFAAALFSLCL
ncbi:hypothetical protein C8R44DRAFT_866231 [Mycena epipterygia]|nr:hypothetical protein C8R44DRAFT_866231 [Mycena epipterygia]